MDLVKTVAEGLVRKCEGKLEPSELDSKIDEKIDEVIPTLALPGFRRGKVPERVVRARFGKELRSETLSSIVEDAVKRHFEETGDRPVQPPLTDLSGVDSAGESIGVTIEYECMPKMPEVDFAEIELVRPVPKDVESLVQEDLEALALSMSAFEDTDSDYEAMQYDQVTIDLRVLVDGVEREDLRNEDMLQVVESAESAHPIAGGLTGVKAGETRTINGELPANVAGQDSSTAAEFVCLVKVVRKAVPPEVDEEFAQRIGVGNLDEIRNESRQRWKGWYAVRAERIMHQKLLDELDERVEFELPPTLLERETESVKAALASEKPETDGVEDMNDAAENEESSTASTAQDSSGAEPGEEGDGGTDPSSEDAEAVRIAERRLKLGLFLAELARDNDLKVTSSDYDEWIASQHRHPEERRRVSEALARNPEIANQLVGTIIERKSLKFITELATKKDEELDREELVKKLEELLEDSEE